MNKKMFSVNNLPAKLRKWIYRHKLNVDTDLITKYNITLKVAETEDELLQAFALVQSMYEKAKIVKKPGAGLRITKFHLLPTTKVLIAKVDDTVIATVSQIMDTPMGLPIDSFIPIDNIRKKSIRLCEISSLAIHPDWRSRSQGLFIPLSLFLLWYGLYVTGADGFVIITNERARFVYEDLFLFEPININSQEYGQVDDKGAFAQYLNLNEIENKYLKAYYKAPKNKNMYQMLLNPKWMRNIKRDIHKYKVVPIINFKEETLDKVFSTYNNLNSLSDSEKQVIYNHYSFYKKNYGQNIFIHQRKHPRFYTRMKADISIKNKIYDADCIQISKGGASFKISEDFPLDQEKYTIRVYLDSHESCSFTATLSWSYGCQAGFEADPTTTSRWESYLAYIESSIAETLQVSPQSA